MPQVKLSYPQFVAKHEFASKTDEELGFKKGELLYVLDTSDGGWWFAKSKYSGQEGYVPSNYLTKCNLLEAEE